MENEAAIKENKTNGNIKVFENAGSITVRISPKGMRGHALVTLIVILLWIVIIAVWTVLLGLIKPLNMLYSVPFWAIGLWTLFKAIKMMQLEQILILDAREVTLQMKRGSKFDERKFPLKEITVSLVEGSYYSYSGLSKRGQYPALIYKNEAFGIGERTSGEQKKWLVDFLNEKLNTI